MKIIPEYEFPKGSICNAFIEEELVNLKTFFGDRIFIEPVYYNAGISQAMPECFARRGLVERLEKALNALPENITFKVFDAWRPVAVQESLYSDYFKRIAKLYPDWTDAQLEQETIKFVSKPVYDKDCPAVHSTGGAIDLTLAYQDSGESLSMGTEFDDFSDVANTRFFEETDNEQIKNNRRLLYWTMINAGFTNLPTEWWHYDFGTRFWSYYTKKPAIYGF